MFKECHVLYQSLSIVINFSHCTLDVIAAFLYCLIKQAPMSITLIQKTEQIFIHLKVSGAIRMNAYSYI